MASPKNVSKRVQSIREKIISDCNVIFEITEIPTTIPREALIKISTTVNGLIQGLDMDIREEAYERK